MPRHRQRLNLQDGLKLDINRLSKNGFIRPGAKTGPVGIRWSHSYWGEIASGVIIANMSGTYEGWFRINIAGGNDQWIMLEPCRRPYGGFQWYFLCPFTKRRVSTLWQPPGAQNFACGQHWGRRRVAYATQFLDRDNRAHYGQSKIKNRLIGDLDPDEWSLPPKPKWMRWRTYNRYVDKFDHYETVLDEGVPELMAKLMGV